MRFLYKIVAAIAKPNYKHWKKKYFFSYILLLFFLYKYLNLKKL